MANILFQGKSYEEVVTYYVNLLHEVPNMLRKIGGDVTWDRIERARQRIYNVLPGELKIEVKEHFDAS